MCTIPVLSRVCRESYNEPGQVYETLKRRGMGLVTVTDHDSMEAAEKLGRYADFFASEEVTCTTPSGTEIHVGVYDIHERQHAELQRRRTDFSSMLAFLREQGLLFSINHAFSRLTGRRTRADLELFEEFFPAFEILNGQMLRACNRPAAAMAQQLRRIALGGSDGHALFSLGLTYTEVHGARDKREFMDGLRADRARVLGQSGSFWKLTRSVWEVGSGMVCEKGWAWALAPLFLAVPAVTAVNCALEAAFARRWSRGLRSDARMPAMPEAVS